MFNLLVKIKKIRILFKIYNSKIKIIVKLYKIKNKNQIKLIYYYRILI